MRGTTEDEARRMGGRATAPGERHGDRRSYRPPRLECHGRLVELTRFGGSQTIDSGSGLGRLP